MKDPLRNIPEALKNEAGLGGFVCIWRQGFTGKSGRNCTVGEWLSAPENQSGLWMIDGGWGAPPGAIHVRWNDSDNAWEYGGYCGRLFSLATPKQEPVAFIAPNSDLRISCEALTTDEWGARFIPLYLEPQPAQAAAIPKMPDKIKNATRTLESIGYAKGWNDCIDSILSASPKPEK